MPNSNRKVIKDLVENEIDRLSELIKKNEEAITVAQGTVDFYTELNLQYHDAIQALYYERQLLQQE